MTAQAGSYLGIVFSTKWLSSPRTSRHHITSAHSTPKVRTMKTLVAVAILAMVIVPPRSREGEAGAIGAPARLSVVGATRLLPRLPSEGLVPRRRLVSGPQVKESA